MTSGLARDCIPELCQCARELDDRTHHEEASNRDDLVFDEVQADYGRFLRGVEMAGDGIADHGFQFVERICLGENGKTQGTGFVAAFRRFLNRKDDFAFRHASSGKTTPFALQTQMGQLRYPQHVFPRDLHWALPSRNCHLQMRRQLTKIPMTGKTLSLATPFQK